jgi:hypothetical protein
MFRTFTYYKNVFTLYSIRSEPKATPHRITVQLQKQKEFKLAPSNFKAFSDANSCRYLHLTEHAGGDFSPANS